jgi:hypothetical protein
VFSFYLLTNCGGAADGIYFTPGGWQPIDNLALKLDYSPVLDGLLSIYVKG